MKLGLREANQEFSRVVRAVRAGQEVVFTDRGEAIAVLTPLTGSGPERAFQAMVAEGFVQPARPRGPMKVSRFRPLKLTGRPLSEAIGEAREERF
jgi:prevent-host-death family protein